MIKKLLVALLTTLLIQNSVFSALSLDDITEPKDTLYRLGPTDNPEKKLDLEIQPTIQPVVQKDMTVKDTQNITYADLSIKKMS